MHRRCVTGDCGIDFLGGGKDGVSATTGGHDGTLNPTVLWRHPVSFYRTVTQKRINDKLLFFFKKKKRLVILQRPFKCFDGWGLAKGKSGPPAIFANTTQ